MADAGGVKSARRVLDLVELLAVEREGLTFPELLSQLGFPKSSLHALVWTLAGRSWIVLDESTRRYRLGVRAWEVGQHFQQGADLAAVADPHLRAARDELGETVQLAILDGIDNVYIAKVEADHPLRLVSGVGSRLPAYATGLGKVLLAALPDAEIIRRFDGVTLERFTPRTVGDVKELLKRVRPIRVSGYGTDDGEYSEGVFCVAAPVFNRDGQVVAAMSSSIPDVRLRTDRRANVERVRDVVIKHTTAISADLGWQETVHETSEVR